MANRISGTKKAKAKLYTIKELLSNYIFNVPEYQRSYSWGAKERRDLFSDITEELDRNEDIFMSTIVTLSKENKTIGGKKYSFVDLVDGQQRITTIVILLKAIYKVKKEQGVYDLEIEDLLIKKGTSMVEQVLHQGSHKSSTMLNNYIADTNYKPVNIKTHAERNLTEAFEQCNTFVKYEDYYEKNPCQKRDLAAIDKIKTVLLEKYKLINYELPKGKESEVYKTFESLNSRGLPVAAIDNLKSQLMGIAFENNDTQAVKELHNIWSEIYDIIGEERINEDDIITISATLFKALNDDRSRPKTLSDAMEYFYNVAKQKNISDDNVPKLFKNDNPSLDTQGNRCQNISNIIKKTAAEMVAVRKDKRISAVTDKKQARVLLVAIMMSDYCDSEKEVLRTAWEKTTFRLFCLHRKDSRSFVGDYTKCANRIINGDPVDDVKTTIEEIGKQFTLDDGVKNVKGVDWYPDYNDDVIYILRRYDERLAEAAGATVPDIVWRKIWEGDASKSIEHIFPKTYPTKASKISSDFKKNWVTGQGRGAGINSQGSLDKFVNNIGNLTLLDPDMNSKAGQKPYQEKVSKYYGNGMRIHPNKNSSYLNSNGCWTKSSVEQREMEILDFIKKEWK